VLSTSSGLPVPSPNSSSAAASSPLLSKEGREIEERLRKGEPENNMREKLVVRQLMRDAFNEMLQRESDSAPPSSPRTRQASSAKRKAAPSEERETPSKRRARGQTPSNAAAARTEQVTPVARPGAGTTSRAASVPTTRSTRSSARATPTCRWEADLELQKDDDEGGMGC
jgi:hypothetical protein